MVIPVAAVPLNESGIFVADVLLYAMVDELLAAEGAVGLVMVTLPVLILDRLAMVPPVAW